MDSSLIPADDTGVWDELSHQQSREIAQHLQQQQHQLHGDNSNSRFMVPEVVQQTVTRIRTAATAAATSIRQKRRHHYGPVDTNLSDFGIPNDDPLLEQESSTAPPSMAPAYSNPLPQQQHRQGQQQEQTANKNEFVFLENFRLLPKQDGWGAVANLDLFFTSLYNYYYHRGFLPILTKGVVELVSLFVTLWLSVFLFAYVDWKGLASCNDEDTCRAYFGEYILEKPFDGASLWHFIVVLYCILFACYSLFSVWSFWRTLKDAWESKQFFEDRLGISARRLAGGAVDWDRDVVTKLLELQETGNYRIAIHGQGKLDALVIAQRILRKENFLVAFFNRNMLDLNIPFSNITFFCKSLEWSLYFCVVNYMFNHKYQIRPAFYLDPEALKRRFMLCGLAHILFMPFLLFFMTLHFAMQNVYDFKSTKQYLGPREWSLAAKWTMREFNELPHFFEQRLEPSYEATDKYLKLFVQSELMTMAGRILALIGGSLAAVTLVFAGINDAILLHVKIGDHNLLWFAGIMGVIYSVGKSMLPNQEVHPRIIGNLFAEMDSALEKVATHTHHYPDTWRGKGFDMQTYKAVSAMFKFKAQTFVFELASVVVAPYILCVALPKCAEHICDFVLGVKADVAGAGEVCGFSTFDFDTFCDESWEGRTMGRSYVSDLTGSISASVHQLRDIEAASKIHEKPKAWQGKIEKSFFNFKACHPSWKSTKSGQTLLDVVEDYKMIETMALAREQQQHIAAAARQLDTLARLERQRAAVPSTLMNINEAYIQNKDAPQADAGAGGSDSPQRVNDNRPNLSFESTPSRVQFSQNETQDSTAPPFAVPEHAALSSPQGISRQALNLGLQSSNTAAAAATSEALSVIHYADIGLSTELQRMLNRSTLDSEFTAGSVLGPSVSGNFGQLQSLAEGEGSEEHADQRTAREYMWLQRYHSQVSGRRGHPRSQQQQQQQQEEQQYRGTQSYMAPEPPQEHFNDSDSVPTDSDGLARSANL